MACHEADSTMTRSSKTPTGNPNLDVVLIGAGIMSATLAILLKRLDPALKIEIHEVLGSAAQESSNAWNNAGTGHAALCERTSPGCTVNVSPWKRAYVIFKEGVNTQFVPDAA